MNTVSLDQSGEGRFAVVGDMIFSTVGDLLERSVEIFSYSSGLEIDLVGVERADSAGLALLIEWMKYAKRNGCGIDFLNMPGQMRAISRTSELDEVLRV